MQLIDFNLQALTKTILTLNSLWYAQLLGWGQIFLITNENKYKQKYAFLPL